MAEETEGLFVSNIRGDCEDAYLGVHPLRSVQGKFRGQHANVTPHVKFTLQPILLKTQSVHKGHFDFKMDQKGLEIDLT